MVDSVKIASMIVNAVVLLGFFVFLWIFLRKKGLFSLKSFWLGMFTFLVFVMILETLLHNVMFRNPTTSEWLKNPFVLAVYGAFAAGIFEEVGRYLGFRFLLKNQREFKDGVSFGFGHGGIEYILFGIINLLPVIVFAFLIQSGDFANLVKQTPELKAVQVVLTKTPYYYYLFAIFERISGLALHIALSLTVLYGVIQRRIGYLFLAIFLHAFVDFFAGLYQAKQLNFFATELIVVLAGVISFFAVRKMKNLFATQTE